jgi:putative ABC transport system ATP-binding protein
MAVTTEVNPDAAPADPPSVLGRALRRQRRDVVLAGSLVTVHQLAEILVPVTIGLIIDRAIAPGDAGQAVQWLVVLAVQFVVLSAAGCTALFVDERARMNAVHTTRMDVAERVLHPGGGVEQALPGEVVSLATVETTRIGDGIGAVIMAIGAITGVIAGAVILFTTSFWLGLAVVLGLPIVLLVVQALAEPLVSRADEHQEAVGVASGVAADLLQGLRVLKGLGADAAAAARYDTASQAALRAGLDANRVRSSYAGLTATIAGVFVILVAWIGARQALDGQIGVGQLVAALGVTQFLVGPLGRLAFAAGQLAQSRASADRLGAAIAAPPTVRDGDRSLPADARGALSVDGLSTRTLRGVSFTVEPGAVVGVVAEPVDAAALIDCLDRSVDPDHGAVLVDGVPHTQLTLDEARRAVVVAHHDAPLFAGSVRANIAEAAPGEIERYVAAASLHDVLQGLTGGIDGELTEAGRSLSGGQRQRVALARALATDAPVLVLHEPTTAVDTATEHRVAAGLRAVRGGRTTLVVTASPTLLAEADTVVFIRDGEVAAVGSHDKLVSTDASYRRAVLQGPRRSSPDKEVAR